LKLEARSGAELELVVLGYQHPDLHEDRWGSNWLIVNGTVTTPGGEHWRFSEPCLTTFELADCAEWIEALAENGRHPSTFAFAEPNLTLSYTPWPRTLHVTLKGGSAPPSAGDTERQRGVTLDFPLNEVDPRDVVDQIRSVLADYPVRGGAA
jgi:hypothetical protein